MELRCFDIIQLGNYAVKMILLYAGSLLSISAIQLTGPKIGERLSAEAESNLSVNVAPTPAQDAFEVQGRGELQLGIYTNYCHLF